MKRITKCLCGVLGLCLALQTAKADDVPAVQGNRIQFAPVFVNPTMQWAVPNSTFNGPPWCCQIAAELLAITVGVGGHGYVYDIDWVWYYKSVPCWPVPDSAFNGPPASLSSGMMMMPH
ncbi:MAG TPA: hypothetical protein VKE98_20475 [Gemmataceae bacterium]|nr:hypothetical protein [Gemmataceae bacterium]